ncbi:TIGR01244 family sulfur transferase [Stakelama tenebrarum]|uniref:TIGR01244 family phosphatase n=1 Tax=Stakelama tenebrarum TaxID=2711215 RepID=A0A6G6Y144_9SPHN|nr:TIGR01244 family sulfur transferase [Sphingosinithalassobacter tenebrarum]QIG78664.1 TIGR01244 family phosphatase [Sphingosinithalassobacter tenebrarum]
MTGRKIDSNFTASPQITPEQVADIKAAGFTTLVCNRPDGEEEGQPRSADVRAAAQEAGLHWEFIPVTAAGFSGNQVEAMVDTLKTSDGPVFAYCRSGTRSTNLWALARASEGDDPETLTAAAANGGYDISAIRPLLDTLSGKG